MSGPRIDPEQEGTIKLSKKFHIMVKVAPSGLHCLN